MSKALAIVMVMVGATSLTTAAWAVTVGFYPPVPGLVVLGAADLAVARLWWRRP